MGSFDDDVMGANNLADDLETYRDDLIDMVEANPIGPIHAVKDDDDGPWGDVRLQYHDGQFSLHTGDVCFDTDGRGAWGVGSISATMDRDDLVGVAAELIEDCADSYAQMDA